MALLYRIGVVVLCWWFSTSLFAAQITGTVTNGTTNKPAADIAVVLLSLDGGMTEVSHATTDSQGIFSIDVPNATVPHLLRVNYQGVNYFRSAPPGTTTADITIYNAAKQVERIFEDARVYRMQTGQGQLEVSTTYTLRNESQPPRTKMDEETFEVELPARAQLVEATATGPGGMPLATSPVPTGKNNRYAMVFPIRPGLTQFQVLYKLPYTGSYEFNFKPDSQLSELGVLLPKSMQFNGLSRSFARDADEAGLAVYFLKNVPVGELVRFSVSGEGVAPQEGQAGGPPESVPAGGASSNTGFWSASSWYVLAGIVVLVGIGAFWLWHGLPKIGGESEEDDRSADRKPQTRYSQRVPNTNPPESMLDALKDELFQLERDRLDGKLSPEDYERSKAGLDALLRRQLKKSKS